MRLLRGVVSAKVWLVVLLLLAALVLSGRAQGGVILTFSEPDFEWLANGTSPTPYHIWTTGDYWAQDFTATGLASASTMSLRLFVDDNGLAAGQQVDLDVLLSANVVGSISLLDGVTGDLDYDFSFPAVAGPDYRVELLETNTVPLGDGAVSIGLGGQSFVTLGEPISEPAGLGLMGLALLALRRRN